ncbi:MAG TPA: DUF192 domain-containing protein [Candidatus Peribacteraceae bacterium]|nr:DUF192 domain-containing protein [Candidatus Peribacteraceae bacterium]
MTRYASVAALLLFTLVFVSCSSPQPNLHLRAPDGHAIGFFVEFARTDAEHQRGLMGRTELARNAGMIFVFDDEKNRAFWMKNTVLPLDIIYFDQDGKYVSSTTMQPCTKDPCPSYVSEGTAQYALEVNAGIVQKSGIGQGWRLENQ